MDVEIQTNKTYILQQKSKMILVLKYETVHLCLCTGRSSLSPVDMDEGPSYILTQWDHLMKTHMSLRS